MRLCFTLLLIILSLNIHADPIDSLKAMNIAYSFLVKKTGKIPSMAKNLSSNNLVCSKISADKSRVTDIYIIKNTGGGFVIVSGDTKAPPILAFSTTDILDSSVMPQALKEWFIWKTKEIRDLVENTKEPSEEVTLEWANINEKALKSGAEKEPLIKTTWSQGVFYNDLCPQDDQSDYSNKKVPAGCGATAMAQLLKYWEYPGSGNGSFSYSSPYGTLSANFGATSYEYDLMPNLLSSDNDATAKLIYHCGVSLKTDYAPDGSSSSISDVKYALKNYFNYSGTISSKSKYLYSSSAWNALLKNELDNNRPIFYRGASEDNTDGHFFICDGYWGEDYYHINWGWNGYCNGYFLLNSLLPGSNNFNYFQYAIIGIAPSTNSLVVHPKIMTLSSEAGASNSLRIVSNSSWSITSDASWLNMEVITGSGYKEITVTADINNSGIQRSAIITVTTTSGIIKTMTINQLASSDLRPNLKPYNPGWDGVMVISNVQGTKTNNNLVTTDNVYLDYAFANISNKDTDHQFNYKISLDGKSIIEYVINKLTANYYYNRTDYNIGTLSEGEHTLSLIIDSYDEIVESNEEDNTYIITFNVSPPPLPSPTHDNQIYHEGIIIYPNPVTDKLNIYSDEYIIDNITLIGSKGEVIERNCLSGNFIDFSKFPSGVYFLKIEAEDRIILKKIIKN